MQQAIVQDPAENHGSSACTSCSDCPGATSAEGPSRRNVLRGAAAAGVAGAAALGLAACGPDDSSSADAAPTMKSIDLGAATDVPVGGGKVFRDDKVVVTQPSKGEYKAFTAVCTHAGCVVDLVADGLIQCPCHGSRYKITDGSVAQGPAPRALAAIPVTVQGGKLIAGS